jgi:two-component system, OmpR family, phosphate regulon sensor histidine kinase PhoR
MADGVLAVDKFTKVIVYNGAALNILDLNQSIKGKSLAHLLQLADHNNQPVDVLEYIRGIKIPTVSESLKLRYQDGSTINIYLSVSPVSRSYKSGSQSGSGYVIVLRDITREKSLEEERDEFIGVVSHELRTPIAIAEGNISNAQFVVDKAIEGSKTVQTVDGQALGKIKQALHGAHEQILFLASMINDLSTLSRAERGKLVAEVEQINIHSLVTEVVSSYTDQATKKGLQLTAELDPKLELLSSSKLYVREVLQNFITNAIKYTEAGSVTISAKPHSQSNSRGVQFTVRDTGIGISHGDQEKIFDKFFRSEDFRTRQNNGTGLGLYITIKLARILHAEIDVSSRLNHGSSFTIFIPNIQS